MLKVKELFGKIFRKISQLRGMFLPHTFIKAEQFFLERKIEGMQYHPGYKQFSEILRSNIPRGSRVLDVGCNKGFESLIIAKTNSVVGIDLYEEFVKEARQRGVDARVVDFHNMTFKEEFDCVFSNNSLEHSPYPEKVLRGARKALKTGGLLILGLPLDGNNLRIKDPAHFFRATEADVISLMENNGFEIQKKEKINTMERWGWSNPPADNEMLIAVAKKI